VTDEVEMNLLDTAEFRKNVEDEEHIVRGWLTTQISRSKLLPPDELIHQTVEITPTMARIMLAEHNRGNRALKQKRFRYAKDIRDGKWKMHSQGISFARDGLLNNGQNRLTAIVLADRPAKMSVAFGEDRAVFSVLDTGATRGGADTLHVAGVKNTYAAAAAARLFNIVTSAAPRANASYSNDVILQTINDHPGIVDQTTAGQRIATRLKMSGSPATVAFHLIEQSSKYAERLPEFIEYLAVGNIPEKRNPILVLREALKDRRLAPPRGGSYAPLCAAVILAWNLWVRGKGASLSQITWGTDKPFPKPE
jgi:hypothetical protein